MRTLSLIVMMAGIKTITACSPVLSRNNHRSSISPDNMSSHNALELRDSSTLLRSAVRYELVQALKFAEDGGYSTEYLFLIDMSIASGKNRFFVYNLKDNRVELLGLVAHGSCNTHFLEQAKFSNKPNCGCSSIGKYKIGASYRGEFGKSYRLFGLDSTNSNALKRGIVLHGFDPVPEHEIYPQSLCNSFGCPMVNRSFLTKISNIIDHSSKPILLWIFE